MSHNRVDWLHFEFDLAAFPHMHIHSAFAGSFVEVFYVTLKAYREGNSWLASTRVAIYASSLALRHRAYERQTLKEPRSRSLRQLTTSNTCLECTRSYD